MTAETGRVAFAERNGVSIERATQRAATALARSRGSTLFFGTVAVAAPFAIGAANILNHFYRHGAYLLDSGLLAYLMTHPDPRQPMPAVLDGVSFYQMHVSPVFTLLAYAAQVTPLSPPQFFAAFIGFCQALVAGGVYWALTGPVGLRGPGALLAAILSIAFTGSGLAVAILRFPHFEMLIVGMAILFLVALHERRYLLAGLFLLVALLTREDAGFHITGILAVIVVARRLLAMDRADEGIMLGFLAAAFLYSAAALAVQHACFPDNSSFARIYAGTPPFAHLTWSMIAERMTGWAVFRTYAVLPAAVAVVWAILAEKPYLFAGYASVLPWLALQLAAVAVLPATLSSYYAFPLMIASFWPLLGALGDRREATRSDQREIVVGFALMIAATFTALSMQHNPNKIGFADTFAMPPDLAEQRTVERGVAALVQARDALGIPLLDDGVASLAPDAFKAGDIIWNTSPRRIDTAIYFEHGYQAREARRRAAASGLSRHYRVTGTHILIATDRDLGKVRSLRQVIEPVVR